jgi:cytochrome c553
MKQLFFILFAVLFISCNSTKEEAIVEITPAKNFYKQSEMAALMLLMYEKNEENKKLILAGKSPKEFPEEFLKIHTAQLTDSTDRNQNFEAFSKYYIKSIKQVFSSPQDSLIENHNTAINSCIACHETTCVGPIPRIKKLLIQ